MPLQQQFADTGGKVINAQQTRASQSLFVETREIHDHDSSSSSSAAAVSPRFKIVELPSNEEDSQNSAIQPVVKAIYMEDE